MSGYNYDLQGIVEYERLIIRKINDLALLGQLSPMQQEMLKDARARIALVRAVRSARRLIADTQEIAGYPSADELRDALEAFTDSAEGDDD